METFIQRLQVQSFAGPVINPWRDAVAGLDHGAEAPLIRTAQLREYLESRQGRARYLLVAEAMSYQGGRFTGVPLCSERMLLGQQPEVGAEVFLPVSKRGQRTSLPAVRPHGFAEPTATIVWKALLSLGVAPDAVVMWNIFPFHPYNPTRGGLSNRTPTAEELALGGELFRSFHALFPDTELVAVGRKAEQTLHELGIPTQTALRHPANGGATAFKTGLHTFFESR